MKIDRRFEVSVWSALLAALLGCAGPSPAQAACPVCKPAPAGITNWYPGDFNAQDLLSSNAGTISGVTYTPGQVQNAFTFAGNGLVQFGANVANFGTSNFSIAFWIKAGTAYGYQAVMENRTICGGNVPFWTIVVDDQGILAGVANSNQFFSVQGSKNVEDGNFHHVVWMRQYETLSLYVDGVLDTSVTDTPLIDTGSPNDFHAGTSVCQDGFSQVSLSGQLDEIQIYNKVLTPSEIRGLFNAGHLGNCK